MTDPLAELRKAMDTIRFAEIVREESRRTVLCTPADVDRMRWLVDQSGHADLITVVESLHVPAGQAWVVDRQAIEAGTAEAIHKATRRWRL